MPATPRTTLKHWAWGAIDKWWLYKGPISGRWVVCSPRSNRPYSSNAFDSWSSAMAFILATDTRKAASS